jgi:hypothetical protein
MGSCWAGGHQYFPKITPCSKWLLGKGTVKKDAALSPKVHCIRHRVHDAATHFFTGYLGEDFVMQKYLGMYHAFIFCLTFAFSCH